MFCFVAAAQVAKLLGPYYVPFIIKELRTGLQRGYQVRHTLELTFQPGN